MAETEILLPMRTRIFAATGVIAISLFLAACGPDDTTATGHPSGNGGASVSASNEGGGGTGADCLQGTWHVDVPDMASQAAAKAGGATGAGSGDITLTFGDQMKITYTKAVMKITKPMSNGITMVMTATFNGSAESTEWSAADGKLAGVMPTNGVTMKLAATIGGKTVPLENMPFQGALNMSEGNLGYTCSGSTATLISPGATWHLTKA
jgi:hypothetical protein